MRNPNQNIHYMQIIHLREVLKINYKIVIIIHWLRFKQLGLIMVQQVRRMVQHQVKEHYITLKKWQQVNILFMLKLILILNFKKILMLILHVIHNLLQLFHQLLHNKLICLQVEMQIGKLFKLKLILNGIVLKRIHPIINGVINNNGVIKDNNNNNGEAIKDNNGEAIKDKGMEMVEMVLQMMDGVILIQIIQTMDGVIIIIMQMMDGVTITQIMDGDPFSLSLD